MSCNCGLGFGALLTGTQPLALPQAALITTNTAGSTVKPEPTGSGAAVGPATSPYTSVRSALLGSKSLVTVGQQPATFRMEAPTTAASRILGRAAIDQKASVMPIGKGGAAGSGSSGGATAGDLCSQLGGAVASVLLLDGSTVSACKVPTGEIIDSDGNCLPVANQGGLCAQAAGAGAGAAGGAGAAVGLAAAAAAALFLFMR